MNYIRKTNDVQAVRTDGTTGDITIGGTTVPAGNWLIVDGNGAVTTMDDATFNADYEPAPEPAPAEPAPVDPNAAPVEAN